MVKVGVSGLGGSRYNGSGQSASMLFQGNNMNASLSVFSSCRSGVFSMSKLIATVMGQIDQTQPRYSQPTQAALQNRQLALTNQCNT
jgi:hypothetical protein